VNAAPAAGRISTAAMPQKSLSVPAANPTAWVPPGETQVPPNVLFPPPLESPFAYQRSVPGEFAVLVETPWTVPKQATAAIIPPAVVPVTLMLMLVPLAEAPRNTVPNDPALKNDIAPAHTWALPLGPPPVIETVFDPVGRVPVPPTPEIPPQNEMPPFVPEPPPLTWEPSLVSATPP